MENVVENIKVAKTNTTYAIKDAKALIAEDLTALQERVAELEETVANLEAFIENHEWENSSHD